MTQVARRGEDPIESARSSTVRRSAWWWIRAAAIALTLVAGYQFLVVLGGLLSVFLTVVLYVVFGGVVALVVAPVVDLLERWRVPRTGAILVTLLGLIGIAALVVYLTAGPTVDEARTLAAQVPDLIHRANGELAQLRDQLRSRGVDTSSLDLNTSGSSLANRISGVLLTTVGGTLTALLDVIIVLVVAFWLLKDGAQLRRGLLVLLPARARVQVEFALDATAVVIGGYVRAQLLLALVIGALAGVGCAILGVPFPIVVALAAFVFELVPIVGPFVGGAVAMALAITKSVDLAAATLVLFIVIHIIEGYVLGPRIQAKFVRLHPVVSLLALFAGIDIAGFLGALFAVPLASLAAVFIRAGVGDLRVNRPELYAPARADRRREERRARILGEFRLFSRSPMAIVRSWVSGRRGRSSPDPAAAPAPTPESVRHDK